MSIIVVAARRPERLLRCLGAIARELPVTVAAEVIVVLNAAEPSLATALAHDVDGATVVESAVALGLAGGVNLGARAARGELLHVLHDDAEVGPGWLTALVEVLDAHPEAGAVASVLLNPDGTLQSAGWVLWRDGRTTPTWLGAPPAPPSPGPAFPVDYGPTASLLLRRGAWEMAGGLDEELHPAYYVDVDLAMALRDGGAVVLCAPRSMVRHDRGGSASLPLRRFLTERNRARFVAKWQAQLVHQEAYAEGAEALARAAAATRRRASTLVAAGARTPLGPFGSQCAETRTERLEREHRQLAREAAVRAAYAAHLEQELGAQEEFERRAGDLHAEVDRLHAHVAARDRNIALLLERIAELDAQVAAVAAANDRAERDIAKLRERERTLVAIENGGWWRLRGRLLALARLRSRAATSRRE